jgi:hypothetical protein
MNNGDVFPAPQVWQFPGTPGAANDLTQAPRGFYTCLSNAAGAALWSAKYI